MIDLKNVSYETNSRELFSDVSFAINAGDKIGLVGLNGVGKTTLLKNNKTEISSLHRAILFRVVKR